MRYLGTLENFRTFVQQGNLIIFDLLFSQSHLHDSHIIQFWNGAILSMNPMKGPPLSTGQDEFMWNSRCTKGNLIKVSMLQNWIFFRRRKLGGTISSALRLGPWIYFIAAEDAPPTAQQPTKCQYDCWAEGVALLNKFTVMLSQVPQRRSILSTAIVAKQRMILFQLTILWFFSKYEIILRYVTFIFEEEITNHNLYVYHS